MSDNKACLSCDRCTYKLENEQLRASDQMLSKDNLQLRIKVKSDFDELVRRNFVLEYEKELRREDAREVAAKAMIFNKELTRLQALFESLFGRHE